MSVTDRFRMAINTLESTLKSDLSMHSSPNNFFTVDGKTPSPSEEMELLDVVACYLSLAPDDEWKTKVFFDLFPLDREISVNHLRFLIKITSLAVCIGILPVLELVSIWLKFRVSHVYASSLFPDLRQTVSTVFDSLVTFVTALNEDLLSIPDPFNYEEYTTGNDERVNTEIPSQDTDEEHPLTNLHCRAPSFADAFLSALTVVYGFQSAHLPTVLVNSDDKFCSTPKEPPFKVVYHIAGWLRSTRLKWRSLQSSSSQSLSPNSLVPLNWTTVDWIDMARRRQITAQTPCLEEQLTIFSPPPSICLIWWTLFGPMPTRIADRPKIRTNKQKAGLASALSELHLEILQCLTDHGPVSSGSTGSNMGHRLNNIVPAFANWFFSCSRKREPTMEFVCLELLVRFVNKRCPTTVECDRNPSLFSTDQQCSDTTETCQDVISASDMTVIRLAEFMQLAWFGGRIRGLNPDELVKLLTPLTSHKLINLICHLHRR